MISLIVFFNMLLLYVNLGMVYFSSFPIIIRIECLLYSLSSIKQNKRYRSTEKSNCIFLKFK